MTKQYFFSIKVTYGIHKMVQGCLVFMGYIGLSDNIFVVHEEVLRFKIIFLHGLVR